MGIVRILKPGLFLYEFLKIIVILTTLMRTDNNTFVIFAAPYILFPLMAIFIWLDTPKYKVYLPLSLAGKCINIVLLMLCPILLRLGAVTSVVFIYYLSKFMSILIGGEFLAVAAILIIMKSVQNTTKAPVIDKTDDGAALEEK